MFKLWIPALWERDKTKRGVAAALQSGPGTKTRPCVGFSSALSVWTLYGRAGSRAGWEWKRVWWPVTASWLQSGVFKIHTPGSLFEPTALDCRWGSPDGKTVYLTTVMCKIQWQEVPKTAEPTIYVVSFWSKHTRCPSSSSLQTPCRWGMHPFTSWWPTWKLVSHFLFPWLHSSATGDDKDLKA